MINIRSSDQNLTKVAHLLNPYQMLLQSMRKKIPITPGKHIKQ